MNGNGSTVLVVMAVTKAVIAVLLVLCACWLWVTGRELPPGGLEIILAILGVYFGFSARVYQVGARRVRRVERIMAQVEDGHYNAKCRNYLEKRVDE